ncbi:sulfurtransferase TusA family protein [Photobacterium sp. ZSDE20]|uniref:Sulfurtransferase TusA family protein n=1 Tax=Photobacterium pectinilyticum TaxID=2906793 RepID=A0ABT1N7P0_9GAMM|nr:sulfurtransferase TusA family protein [Photobacterium sp. ZSDE20]MCQ1060771.1 sulfurtransferase TusA family protein [Photobacterium sp. ZSDE20]MDD1828460.1 sulfurtransferase TusA family protein [Photobacterium sp. ZSDE20]
MNKTIMRLELKKDVRCPMVMVNIARYVKAYVSTDTLCHISTFDHTAKTDVHIFCQQNSFAVLACEIKETELHMMIGVAK